MDSSRARPSFLAMHVKAMPAGRRMTAEWCTAAAALLRVSSKESDGLARLFEDPETTEAARLLVLDLLASAGTVEAQISMRRLLALAVARQNTRTFAAMIQRLGFLERPDGPTLRFLMSVHAEARNEPHDVRAACAYALGAAAGRVRVNGDEAIASRACDVIRRDLRAARTSLEVCAFLTALGNAGLASDANAILRHAADPDPMVRAACARALRNVASATVRQELLAMVADPDARVGQSALSALAASELAEEELDRVAALVLQGRTALALDSRILALFQAQRAARGRNVENALRQLLGRLEARHEPMVATSGSFAAVSASGERAVPAPVVPVVEEGEPLTVRAPAVAIPLEALPEPPPHKAEPLAETFAASLAAAAAAAMVPTPLIPPALPNDQTPPKQPKKPPFSAQYKIVSLRTVEMGLGDAEAEAIQTLACALPRPPTESGSMPRYQEPPTPTPAAHARKRR